MKKLDLEVFGKRVKSKRLKYKLTVRALANQLGINFTTISRVENNKSCNEETYGIVSEWLNDGLASSTQCCPRCEGRGWIGGN